MRAWTVDADDIQVAEDFNESLLHRTPEIEGFLRSDRDDKFIVIGTKGFGKTLLLKAKRILYQRERRAVCLPVGPFSTSQLVIRFLAGNSSPFSWCLPFRGRRSGSRRSVWKHLGAVSGLKVGPGLASLIGDEQLQGVSDHFVRLLEFTPSELQRCGADTDGHLVPRIRAATSPVAIFIDGVDEYFNKHVEGPTSHPSVTGELSPKTYGTSRNLVWWRFLISFAGSTITSRYVPLCAKKPMRVLRKRP
jgi:hypothetical protein